MSLVSRHLTILIALCLIATVAPAQDDFTTIDVHYLAKELAYDGVTPEEVAPKIQPQLLAKLEIDAEAAYFKSDTVGAERSIVVSLRSDRERRTSLLAERSLHGRTSLQREVRSAQDRVLSAVANEAYPGFHLRNRYTTVAGFSAYADFHAIAALARQDDVAYVEEMQVFEAHGILDAEADALTQVGVVHNMGDRGQGVTIAVIDSGIDYTHHMLHGHPFSTLPTPKVIGGYDFGDDDADPKIDCVDDSHGTSTAFIAGGLFGVAPAAQLVHLKVQSASKCGKSSLDGDIAAAIDWVVTNQATYGIDIISMSLGGADYSSPCTGGGGSAYRSALDDADAAGIMVFASSGNDAKKSQIGFPACYPTVYSVGAVYDKDYPNSVWTSYNNDDTIKCQDSRPDAAEVTCYSNSASFLDFLGPSNCAWAATPSNGFTNCFTGTSAAAPFVAGVAALVLDRNPNLTPDQATTYMKILGTRVTDPDNGVTTPLVHAFRTWAFMPILPLP
ncbi:MAG: S8 family serine peptidase [Acidobacteriota bacterium]